MLRRKIMEDLVRWKDSDYRECLLIKGARQVGKTFIIDEFLRTYYPNSIKIDFSINVDMRRIFDGNLSVDDIMQEISIRTLGFKPIPYETVIFFDEIQLCPRARSSLKSFATDGRYRVIASGSLLGLTYGKGNEDSILPMGYEKQIELRPLDFEEFLWAIGMDSAAVEGIRSHIREKSQFQDSTLDVLNRYFSIYTVIGGMPEAVNVYLKTKDINEVRSVQMKVISGYRDDVKKYSDRKDQDKIAASFDSIPIQLSQENKKFKFALIDANYVPTYSTYESGINWMCDASVVQRAFNLSNPCNPLPQYVKSNHFKIYMNDTGLLVCMLGLDAAHAIMTGDTRTNKGAVVENIVAQSLTACGIPLYYYSTNSLEIDFIASMRGAVTAIEVKSGNNTKSKSLKSMRENHSVRRGIKLERTNIRVTEDGVEHYPLFACAFADSMYEDYEIDLKI